MTKEQLASWLKRFEDRDNPKVQAQLLYLAAIAHQEEIWHHRMGDLYFANMLEAVAKATTMEALSEVDDVASEMLLDLYLNHDGHIAMLAKLNARVKEIAKKKIIGDILPREKVRYFENAPIINDIKQGKNPFEGMNDRQIRLELYGEADTNDPMDCEHCEKTDICPIYKLKKMVDMMSSSNAQVIEVTPQQFDMIRKKIKSGNFDPRNFGHFGPFAEG